METFSGEVKFASQWSRGEALSSAKWLMGFEGETDGNLGRMGHYNTGQFLCLWYPISSLFWWFLKRELLANFWRACSIAFTLGSIKINWRWEELEGHPVYKLYYCLAKNTLDWCRGPTLELHLAGPPLQVPTFLDEDMWIKNVRQEKQRYKEKDRESE